MTKTWKIRWADLSSSARQANHVLAAAVIVFTASVLLASVLAPWATRLAVWLIQRWGLTAAAIFAPLFTDATKALWLLLIAFPLGRITAPRPWPTAVGLVALVYGFDFAFNFALGTHVILYGHWRALLGRGLLLAVILLGVVWLTARGRRAAEKSDLSQAFPKPQRHKKAPENKQETDNTKDSSSDPSPDSDCKQSPPGTVTEGER